jgi:hypothetical protein
MSNRNLLMKGRKEERKKQRERERGKEEERMKKF